MQVVPLGLVLAVAVEHLNAMVLPVGDINPALFIGANVVHDVELPGITTRLAPGEEQFTVGRILVHAGVAIAVGNIDLSFGGESYMGAAVKRLAALIGRRLTRDTQGENDFSIQGALSYCMIAIIAQKNRFVGTYRGTVRPFEDTLSP